MNHTKLQCRTIQGWTTYLNQLLQTKAEFQSWIYRYYMVELFGFSMENHASKNHYWISLYLILPYNIDHGRTLQCRTMYENHYSMYVHNVSKLNLQFQQRILIQQISILNYLLQIFAMKNLNFRTNQYLQHRSVSCYNPELRPISASSIETHITFQKLNAHVQGCSYNAELQLRMNCIW